MDDVEKGDIVAIRVGLAANLRTIEGLRASATLTSGVSPPCAQIGEVTTEYDLSMRRGADDLEVKVRVLVGLVTESAAQTRLDRYAKKTGPASVKAALESDRQLGGACDDLRVIRMEGYGVYDYGGVIYLGAEWVVRVIA